MDFLPRIVTSEVWERLAAGVEQRARAVDAFLNDVYGDQAIVAAGRLAPEALDRAPGYRSTGRVMRPGRIRAHIRGSTWCAPMTAGGSSWRTTSGCPRASRSPTPTAR